MTGSFTSERVRETGGRASLLVSHICMNSSVVLCSPTWWHARNVPGLTLINSDWRWVLPYRPASISCFKPDENIDWAANFTKRPKGSDITACKDFWEQSFSRRTVGSETRIPVDGTLTLQVWFCILACALVLGRMPSLYTGNSSLLPSTSHQFSNSDGDLSDFFFGKLVWRTFWV